MHLDISVEAPSRRALEWHSLLSRTTRCAAHQFYRGERHKKCGRREYSAFRPTLYKDKSTNGLRIRERTFAKVSTPSAFAWSHSKGSISMQNPSLFRVSGCTTAYTAFQLRRVLCDTYKEVHASHTRPLVTISAIMGTYVALALRARGVVSIILGIYGAFNPKEFFNRMISPGWEGSRSCDATLNIALDRAAMQYGWQLVALGALLLLLAGQTSLHKTATSIAIFASSSAFGVFFGSEGPRGVAMYHLAWCFLHTVSYEIDRRKDKRQVLSDGTHKNDASSDEKAQPVL